MSVKAHFNVCRHRGSKVCLSHQGSAKRLVCPYHQWSYKLDGSLSHAGHMEQNKGFRKEEFGLKPVKCETVGGMIFVGLSDDLPEFEEARALFEPQWAPHGIESDAKIAFTKEYTVNANWKIIYENNRECYHCAGGHPEYIRANYDLALSYQIQEDGSIRRDITPSFRRVDEIKSHTEECLKRWESMGIPTNAVTNDSKFPGAGWYRCTRSVLRKGWVSESIEGSLLSQKLLGKISEPDTGSLRTHAFPNYWNHMSCDHSVSTRLTPVSPSVTKIKVDWLVHKDAVEGKDYTLEKLLPFWQATSEQDWRLSESTQEGVESSAYSPGPFSISKEFNVNAFVEWYLKKVVQQQ
eukprot:TRINITY_DN1176_c0_g1_i2.p1 TRINITY_DN1176_c0_g1~~TRINITY_DN1176_c0_g1_i2.p1  ORF type:complete len:351 (+),score=89.91 TRINITY_DN1176_c0_g1_i2:466-1518(+)